MIMNMITKKQIACKHKWFKHAIESSSRTDLKAKLKKNIDLFENQHRIYVV